MDTGAPALTSIKLFRQCGDDVVVVLPIRLHLGGLVGHKGTYEQSTAKAGLTAASCIKLTLARCLLALGLQTGRERAIPIMERMSSVSMLSKTEFLPATLYAGT